MQEVKLASENAAADQTTKVEMVLFNQAFDAIEGMALTRIKVAGDHRDNLLQKLAEARQIAEAALLEDQELRYKATATPLEAT